MNKIVVFQSSTGFTKQYAEWIARELNCDAVEVKKASMDSISQYECVIFGGWIMGNMIMGLDKIRKMNPKNLVIYAVGSSPDSEELENTIKELNHIKEEPFYYFAGGFHFKQLKLPVRLMLKAMKKSVAKKENKTKQDQYMLEKLGTSFDISDRKFILPLVKQLRTE